MLFVLNFFILLLRPWLLELGCVKTAPNSGLFDLDSVRGPDEFDMRLSIAVFFIGCGATIGVIFDNLLFGMVMVDVVALSSEYIVVGCSVTTFSLDEP